MKKIYLSGKHADKFTLVDDADYEELSKHKWYFSKSGHVVGTIKGDRIAIHTFIMDYKPRIDHINHDKLDNRRENLREADRSQNGYNRKPPSSRKYKGVCLEKKTGKYHARITVDRKRRHLGTFLTEREAAIAYNEAALKYHGEFAYLNEIEGE